MSSVNRAVNEAGEQIGWLARAGYASRGVVYLIIGSFAALAAIGGGRAEGSKGALQTLLDQPAGTVLVGILLIGLIGYVAWRLIQAIGDTDRHGTSPKGLAIRAGLLASAATYATLALYAASRIGLFSGGGSGSGGGAAQFIAGLVGSRTAAWLLAVVLLGVGIAHCWKAVTAKFEKHFRAERETMRRLRPIARAGLIARGSIFFVLAFLLIYRGVTAGDDGGSPPGIEDALRFVQQLPFGNGLLAIMGVGLMLFAAYSFAEAWWRRVRIPAPSE